MKKIDSNSISESFGISNLELDELYSINGGNVDVTSSSDSISIGTCLNQGGASEPFIPHLMGNIAVHIPDDESYTIEGPSKPISSPSEPKSTK